MLQKSYQNDSFQIKFLQKYRISTKKQISYGFIFMNLADVLLVDGLNLWWWNYYCALSCLFEWVSFLNESGDQNSFSHVSMQADEEGDCEKWHEGNVNDVFDVRFAWIRLYWKNGEESHNADNQDMCWDSVCLWISKKLLYLSIDCNRRSGCWCSVVSSTSLRCSKECWSN